MSINQEDIDATGAWLRHSLERMLNILDDSSELPHGYKRCSTCQKVLIFEEFYRFHRSRDGRLGRCKSCFLKKRKENQRERNGGANQGRTATTPVTSIDELRAALKSPEVFYL